MEHIQNTVNAHAVTLASHDAKLEHVTEKIDDVAKDVAEIKRFVYQIHGGAKAMWIITGAVGTLLGWLVSTLMGRNA
jgi:hypothetical protein